MHSKPIVSLLSSFSVQSGLKYASEVWPREKTQYVELYAFMQADMAWLFPATLEPNCTASHALWSMADARNRSGEAERVAAAVNDLFKTEKLVAITTFLPEISAHEKYTDAWQAAQDALEFIVDLGRVLRDCFDHPIGAIEFVGGSAVDGVWRGIERRTTISPLAAQPYIAPKEDREVFVVNRMEADEAVSRLVNRIERIAKYSANTCGIPLALELEPGPLFTVGDQRTLERFCDLVVNHESKEMTELVGVNLDIAHWAFLAEITVDWVKQRKCVYDRIIHAHICDHSVGHFSDAKPSSFHPIEEYREWVKLLQELLMNRRQSGPRFSGFVSCELECCNSLETVQDALDVVQRMIDAYC